MKIRESGNRDIGGIGESAGQNIAGNLGRHRELGGLQILVLGKSAARLKNADP
jgi:hypothetical protein